MDIESINKYVKFDTDLDLYDLTTPSFLYRTNDEVNLREYVVRKEDEMRIDLIFQSMYNLEPNEVGNFLNNIDIILYINNIDNPLNIREGLTLLYPLFDDFSKFRYELSQLEEEKLSIKEKLVVPNKTTKKDKDREKFKANNYLLPPVVLDTPKPPVRISNGRFSIGGV